MKTLTWFERQFAFGLPEGMFPFYLERLRGTPVRMREKVKGFSEEVLSRQPGGKWSVKENIAHLIEVGQISDRRIDEIRKGAPVLSSAMRPLTTDYNLRPIADILDQFQASRLASVALYQQLPAAALATSAVHPRLNVPMTAVDLAWFDAEHDDHHAVKVNEILAMNDPGSR